MYHCVDVADALAYQDWAYEMQSFGLQKAKMWAVLNIFDMTGVLAANH